MTTTTPKQRLADQLLGGEGHLESFVRERRAEGKAWRVIARDLYETIDVDVTYETLRSWYPTIDEPIEAEAVS